MTSLTPFLRLFYALPALCLLAFLTNCSLSKAYSPSFFVTSYGPGKGGNLGGLKGADAHCQKLAQNAGLPKRKWRAYLSTQSYTSTQRGISARQRIGNGPWYNVRGILIASDISRLHHHANIFSDTALDEYGRPIAGVDAVINNKGRNRHDILTGTPKDGVAFWKDNPKKDRTCNNWTSSSSKGSAIVGHHDRAGGGHTSWINAHSTKGCSQKDMQRSGGDALFYCFAAD